MKLLQRYPELIDPRDNREWVLVEATPIVESTWREWQNRDPKIILMPSLPPWRYTGLEFTEPAGARGRVLCMISSFDDRESVENAVTWALQTEGGREAPALVKGTRRIAEARFAASIARGVPHHVGRSLFLFNDDGAMIMQQAVGTDNHEITNDLCGVYGQLALSVFAFLNCKNVTVQDEPAPPGPVLKKRRKRGVPDIRYKQLVVDGRPITRSAGRETPEEAEFRYHICRGHFADHREHGLFGKDSLKGIYWVPMHVKGSKQNGEIIKDYLIQPATQRH